MTSKLWCAICGYNRKPKGSLVYGCPVAEKYKDWHTKWCDIIGFDETTVKKEPGDDANPLNFRYDIQNPVCSIHFEASCFNEQHKMMENALPTLFLGDLSKAVLDTSVASENDSPPSDLENEITDKMQMAAVDSGISDSSDESCSSPPPLTPIHANSVQGPTPIPGSMDVDSDLPEASDWNEPTKMCMRIEEIPKVDTSPNAFNFDDESTSYRPEGGEHLKRSKPGDLRDPNGIVQQSPVLTRRVTLRRSSRNDAQPKFLRDDESPYFLPTETYVEDYAVPLSLRRLIEKQPEAICGKVYCRLGCICSSLHSSMEIERNHCQKPSCILECVCRQRLRKKGVDESSALALVFFSGTDQGHDAEFESLTLPSEDNRQQSTALSLVDENTKLKKTLFENSTMIKNLQLQLRSKDKELATLKKQISQTAGCLPGLLESLETTKAHLEFVNEIQTVDVGSQPIEAKPLVDASGIYQGVFPFKDYELDLLAEKNTVNMFIRTLMRKLFSDDYLATKSCSLMEKKHHDAITDATLKRFKTYHRRKSLDQPSRAEKLTANHVKFVMRTEFANQYTLMKKKLGL